ncbi:hypothetical protein SADUNF_Sadunf07G0057200 [Salix dunnii]|uniref:Uncharacterized protein n=1 Tax=Salix dunnii TaxID=1413687 RepID=A0A835JZH7_9ROSI|nr:hypothetical protein SADUNF_Sadunf07G0057200 [Salix dunnii]
MANQDASNAFNGNLKKALAGHKRINLEEKGTKCGFRYLVLPCYAAYVILVYRAPQEKDFKRSDGQGPYRSHLKSCCACDSKKQIACLDSIEFWTRDRDRKLKIFPDSEHPFVREMQPRARRAMIRAQKKVDQQKQGGNDKRKARREKLKHN